MRTRNATALALATILVAGVARAQEQEGTRLSPALEQLRETVSDRLHTAADDLGLTADQRAKIREIHAGFAAKYQAQRAARRELRQDEFEELGAILTPEQRDQVKEAVAEQIAMIREGAARRKWPEVASLRDTVADRIESAADERDFTAEQREKIREAVLSFAQKYREQVTEHRNLVEDELKAVGEVLTPAQRKVVRRYIEGRIVRAAAAQTVADRLRAAGDRLYLTAQQRERIRELSRPYAEKFREMQRRRRALLGEEMRAVAKVLTPDQREMVRDWCEDRVVVIGVEIDPANPPTLARLRETLADRLNAAAGELGLTDDERDKIREIRADFAAKYQAQRAARGELRQEELKELGAILTPEQRDQVKAFAEEREESRQDR
jgi:Spy/CpxP family protein refolding chaperone